MQRRYRRFSKFMDVHFYFPQKIVSRIKPFTVENGSCEMSEPNRRIRYTSLDVGDGKPNPPKTHGAFASGGIVSSTIPQYGDVQVVCGSTDDDGAAAKCLWAPDGYTSLVVMSFLLLFTGLFAYTWLSHASDRHALSTSNTTLVVAVAVQLSLTAGTLVAMFVTVLTNPGILRKHCGEASVEPSEKDMPHVNGIPCEDVGGGVKVLRPYCRTCNILRPPRTAHCASCNNCVERFDHHCGLIGVCVGRRNFAYFLRFLMFLLLTAAWMCSWSILLAVRTFTEDGKTWRGVICAIVALVSLIVSLGIGAMYTYYLRIIAKGRTHREELKYDRLYSPPGSENPFDHGLGANCAELCC